MSLHPASVVAILAIAAAVGVGWSRKFLASGALVLANVVIFGLTELGPTQMSPYASQRISTIHAELALNPSLLAAGEPLGFLQVLTSMFVHANFSHLLGNLIILLAFALPFEERIGHRRFLSIYLLAGLAGTLTQLAFIWNESIPLMGASGAVFGIIGAFAAAYPNLVVPLPVPLFVMMIFVRMRVILAAAMFTLLQILLYMIAPPNDPTAYAAHFGGLAMGGILGVTLARSAGVRKNPVRVDLGALKPFAKDAGATAALEHMGNHRDEPQIFQAWLDRFLRTARCPTCDHKVAPRHQGEIVCTQGHRFDVRSVAKA